MPCPGADGRLPVREHLPRVDAVAENGEQRREHHDRADRSRHRDGDARIGERAEEELWEDEKCGERDSDRDRAEGDGSAGSSCRSDVSRDESAAGSEFLGSEETMNRL